MKHYMAVIFSLLTALAFIACDEQTNNNNNDNDDKDTVPTEDTVYAFAVIRVDQGTDSLFGISVSEVPFTFKRFSEVQSYTAKSPTGGAAMFLMALNVYQKYNKEGIKALVCAVSEQVKMESNSSDSYDGYSLYTGDMSIIRSSLGYYPALTTAYLDGATPENGYVPAGPPYIYYFSYDHNNTDLAKGYARLLVQTKGADSPRPVNVVMDKDGLWRAKTFSSLLAGLK